jgi:ribosomal protein S21
LQVLVRDNNIDQALRVLKKKMQREGVFREMKQRKSYESRPSGRTGKSPKRSAAAGSWHAKSNPRGAYPIQRRSCSTQKASPGSGREWAAIAAARNGERGAGPRRSSF